MINLLLHNIFGVENKNLLHAALHNSAAHKKIFKPLTKEDYGVNSAVYVTQEDVRNLVNSELIKLEAIGENDVHYYRCYLNGVDQNRALLLTAEGYGKIISPEAIPYLVKEKIRFDGKNFKVGKYNIENLMLFVLARINAEEFEMLQVHHGILRADAELDFILPLTKEEHQKLHNNFIGRFTRNQIIHLTPQNYLILMEILNELKENLKSIGKI